jgi:hypothetical protein
MITILTSCWAATKKLLIDVNFPVTLSSISRSIRGLLTPVTFPVTAKSISRSIRGLTVPETFPVDTITTGSKSIRGTTANNFPSSLSS